MTFLYPLVHRVDEADDIVESSHDNGKLRPEFRHFTLSLVIVLAYWLCCGNIDVEELAN